MASNPKQYFAHAAELPDGKRDQYEDHWQLLFVHLVLNMARKFAASLCLAADAELEGFLRQNTFNKQFR